MEESTNRRVSQKIAPSVRISDFNEHFRGFANSDFAKNELRIPIESGPLRSDGSVLEGRCKICKILGHKMDE